MNFNLSSAEQMVQFAVTNKNAILGLVALFCALLIYKMITSADWVKVIIGVGIMILVVHTLTACGVSVSHDFGGFTERAQLRADAQSTQVAERAYADVQVAQAQRDAQVGAAKETAKGVIETARQNADAKIVTAQTWAATLPLVLIILGAGVVLCMGLYWRGRVGVIYADTQRVLATRQQAFLQDQHRAQLLGTVNQQSAQSGPTTLLTDTQIAALYYYAQQQQMRVKVVDGQYYLQKGDVTVKALLKAPDD